MKSLLVLTSTLPRFTGDPEPRFVLDLSKHLARYYRITILAPADPKALPEELLEGVRVVRYRYAPLRSMEVLAYPGAILPRLKRNPMLWLLVPLMLIGMAREARQLLSRESFDCIHCHWLLPQGLVGYFLSRRYTKPYVVTTHGADVFALSSPLARWIKRKVLSHAAAVTVVSTALKQALSTSTNSPSTRAISVIPMGVDTSAFNPDKRDDAWPQGHGLKRPVVAFVGRLSEKKGVRFLIDAMNTPELREAGATLVIVGDGELRKEWEERVRSLALQNRVVFYGAADHQTLPVILASVDIFCLPSIVAAGGDREGMPTVLCEAAASGLPIVATELGGITDFVEHEKTGMLVRQRDPEHLAAAIVRLIEDPVLRTSLVANAQARAREFDWTALAHRFENVFERAITSNSAHE